jgi:hypothetical protein
MGLYDWWLFNSPVLMGLIWTTRNLQETVLTAIKRSCAVQAHHQKVDISQYRTSSPVKPAQRGGSSSQFGAVEKLPGDRDTPVVRNTPVKVTSHGAISSGIPPQGASSYSKPMEGGDLKLVAFKVGSFTWRRQGCLETRGGSPTARMRQGSTRGIQQLGHVIAPKPMGAGTHQ